MIYRHENGFNEFARHLTKEFCIENLLFIVELQQWQTSLGLEMGKIESSDLNISLLDNAPKSQIVASGDCYIQLHLVNIYMNPRQKCDFIIRTCLYCVYNN